MDLEMKVVVILGPFASLRMNCAKDLQFRSEANKCRFFASLRMTDFRESAARILAPVFE